MAKKGGKRWKHKVESLDRKMDIVSYSAKAFSILGSKSAVKKAIEGGRLFLNGKAASFRDQVMEGSYLELRGTGLQQARRFDLSLEVIYEDDFLMVVNKPGGIAVNGDRIKTVENALAKKTMHSKIEDALPRPVAVHRIDVPTSGLVILAKTKKALIQLGRAFQDNKVSKEYMAVVHGHLPVRGRIESPVAGKHAITDFQCERVAPSHFYKHLSLVRLQPITGRTHQLRIHLTEKNHLIVGDKMYAKKHKTILGKGLFLAACRLQFQHPIEDKALDLSVPVPPKFHKLLDREEAYFSGPKRK